MVEFALQGGILELFTVVVFSVKSCECAALLPGDVQEVVEDFLRGPFAEGHKNAEVYVRVSVGESSEVYPVVAATGRDDIAGMQVEMQAGGDVRHFIDVAVEVGQNVFRELAAGVEGFAVAILIGSPLVG